MIFRLILTTAFLITSLQTQATNLFGSAHKNLLINQCNLTDTYEQTDLALINDGYFVLSSTKQNHEFFFTRYGKLYIDPKGYLRVDMGNYLLGMTDESHPEQLTKIKIPSEIAPQTTHEVEMQVNLNANADNKSIVYFSAYDARFKAHKVQIEFMKTTNNEWNVTVFNKQNQVLAQGTLIFNQSGKLIKQTGLEHIQIPIGEGIHEFKIRFTKTTQYNQPFRSYLRNDGHAAYPISQLYFGLDGEINLVSTRGFITTMAEHLAVAKFSAPQYLGKMDKYLYQPTNESGQAMMHGLNSFHAILAGYLEEEPCLAN